MKTAQDAAGAASPQKNKRVISAKSLANLRPNPHNMRHVGGSKAREYATNQEIELLTQLLDGANHQDAARRAGVSKGVNVTEMLLRPVIAKTFAEMQVKRLGESMEASKRRREELSQFIHPEIIHAIRTAKTHSRTGDLGKAKLFEVAGRISGDIASTNYSANATVNATVQAGVAEIDIYKPLWLRESEAQMLAEAKKRLLGPATPPEAGKGPKITPEQAMVLPQSRRRRQRQGPRSRAQGRVEVLVPDLSVMAIFQQLGGGSKSPTSGFHQISTRTLHCFLAGRLVRST